MVVRRRFGVAQELYSRAVAQLQSGEAAAHMTADERCRRLAMVLVRRAEVCAVQGDSAGAARDFEGALDAARVEGGSGSGGGGSGGATSPPCMPASEADRVRTQLCLLHAESGRGDALARVHRSIVPGACVAAAQ